jgi:hypothetical protein
MPTTKPTFYTVFSNSMKPDEYLPNLSEEATKISDLLNGLVFSDVIYYMKDELFTADRLIANFSKYGDKFDIFYFSGHAKDGALRFSDNFISDTDRMADVINVNLRNLQLGFFNACDTFDLAKKIVQKRAKAKNANRLVTITCGCAINAFLAERFATLFFNHVGRPGTYFDAYKNASTLLSLVNGKLRFREFYSLEDLESASEDFEYAFIDIPVIESTAPPSSATGATEPVATLATSGSAPVTSPSGNAGTPATGEVYPEATHSEPPATEEFFRPNENNEPLRAMPTASHSIINADKQTLDILSANYVRECTHTAMTSNALDTAQMEILNQAIKGSQEVVEGTLVTGKVKQLWKEAARILPGVDSKNDFRSLIKVSKGDYDKALGKFFGKANNQPTLANIRHSVDAGD